MKKWLIGVMTVLMAVSLAACTPTTEKQKKETTAAAAAKSLSLIHISPGCGKHGLASLRGGGNRDMLKSINKTV